MVPHFGVHTFRSSATMVDHRKSVRLLVMYQKAPGNRSPLCPLRRRADKGIATVIFAAQVTLAELWCASCPAGWVSFVDTEMIWPGRMSGADGEPVCDGKMSSGTLDRLAQSLYRRYNTHGNRRDNTSPTHIAVVITLLAPCERTTSCSSSPHVWCFLVATGQMRTKVILSTLLNCSQS